MRVKDVLKPLIEPVETRRGQTLSGGTLIAAEMAIGQALRLMSNLVMTRFLVPEAFGLLAIIATLHTGLTLLSDIGIRQSILRSTRGSDPTFLRVAWTVQFLRSCLIAATVIATGLLLQQLGTRIASPGTVYTDPLLPQLILLSSIAIIMRGLDSTAQHLAIRELRFRQLIIVGLASQISGILAMILLVQIQASAWVLVWGMLVSSFVRLALTHLLLEGPRMFFCWNKDIALEIWTFGKWLIGGSLFGYVANNADRIILGALLSKETFGYYVIALIWIQTASNLVQRLDNQIGTSALGQVFREDVRRLPRVFTRYRRAMDLLCILIFVPLVLLGPQFIEWLYPPYYAVSGSFVPFLALGILALRYQVFQSVLVVRGYSKSIFLIATLRAFARVAACVIGYHLAGINGALLGVATSHLAGAPLSISRARIYPLNRVWLESAGVVVMFFSILFFSRFLVQPMIG